MANPNPEVEVVWGGGGWHRSHRRYLRPYVEGAVNLASEAVNSLGINFKHPKQASIRRCGNSYPAVGENQDESGFKLFIRVDDYRRRKAAARFGRYVTASAHELTHSARHERFGDWDLLEEIVSEGIAHTVEDLVLQDLGMTDDYLYSEIVNSMNRNHDASKHELIADYSVNGNDDIVVDKWFDWSSPYMDEGVVIGITEVQNRLIEGHAIGEIIDWPPERVLNIS